MHGEFVFPTRGTVRTGDVHAEFSVTEMSEQSIDNTTVVLPTAVWFERVGVNTYEFWTADDISTKTLPFIYEHEYRIVPIEGVKITDSSNDPGLAFRRRLLNRLRGQFSGSNLGQLSAGSGDENSLAQLQTPAEDEPAQQPQAGAGDSSDTYAVLVLPIVIILIGIAAALGTHKLIK